MAEVADGGFRDGFAGAEVGNITVRGELANRFSGVKVVGKVPVKVAHGKLFPPT